ncbi:hypothetical protein ACTMS2_17150 [Micromonospora sp. SD12]|uniref:hypothetical protein n=1 Tax=Micromonospora sp. SD12 TaxID=3452216 RepID=UPI003F894286
MDADVADRPESGPDPGERATPAATDDRLHGAVLAVAGLAALVGGGWWWQAEAPRTDPVPAASSVLAPADRALLGVPPDASVRFTVPRGSDGPVSVWVDPRNGAAFRADPRNGAAFRTDPRSGARVRVDVADPEPRRAGDGWRQEGGGRRSGLDSFPGTLWTARALLSPGEGLVKQASAEGGARHLLQYRCVGPGELLIVVEGAWAADPITSACDGSMTSTEVTGRGGPFQVSLSSANAEPLRVEAQLVALP